MASYLVETFLSGARAGEQDDRERRARTAAAELAREGRGVCFDGAIHIPEDEISLFLFTASSSRDAALAAARAELDPLRIVQALASREEKR